MNHKNRLIITSALILFLQFSFGKMYGEGSKQLSPSLQDSCMLHTNASGFGNFASYGTTAASASSLHLRISSLQDTTFIGLSSESADGGEISIGDSYWFRIVNSVGTVVFGPFEITETTDNATSYALATNGPDVLGLGGYSTNTGLHPWSRFVAPAVGDYILQFNDGDGVVPTPNDIVNVLWYDVTVRNSNVVKPGRLWSRNWALRTPPRGTGVPPDCAFNRQFNGQFYSYTMDGFVSRIDFDNSGYQGLSFTVSFGDRGPGNTGDVMSDRRSVNDANATSNNADHMVFLNDPDNILFPSSTAQCGEVTLFSVSCESADSFCINVGVTQPGQVEVILDFNTNGIYDLNSQDVILIRLYGTADTVCIPWNGLKGDGSSILFGQDVPAIIKYSQGVQHYAAFDVEFLKTGYCVQTIRPICPGIVTDLLYWDDSQITDDVGTFSIDEGDPGTGAPKIQFNGCACATPTCRSWDNFQIGNPPNGTCTGPVFGYAENATLNTWWFASTFVIDNIFLPFAQVNITGDSVICAGETTSFFANVFPDTITFNFSWSGPGGFTAFTQSTGPISTAGKYKVTITDPITNCTAIDSAILIVNPAPTTSITFTCLGANQSNANVNLTVNSGLPPFTFLWSTGAITEDIFNVTPGTYTVTVTDGNGCTATNSVNVQGCCTLNITCPPSNGGTFQCVANIPPSVPSGIVINSFCNGVTTTSNDTNNGGAGCPASPRIITRHFTVTDFIGNSATCDVTYTVIDNTTSISCPANIAVQCASLVPAPNPASVTTSDNCGGATTVTFLGDVITNQTCANRFVITRTYRSEDGCGNTATCNQTITVNDITPPSISCPGNLTVQCTNLIPQPNIAGVVSTDNCGGASTVTFLSDVIANQTCTNRYNLIRTFRAVDECGNSASCSQTITVFDNTPPSISCPGNVSVQCASQVPAPNTASVIASDNCNGVASVTFVSDQTTNQTCTNRFNIIRTYRATDECGNSATCSQTIFVLDNIVPSITCPGNVTVQCANAIPAVNTASVVSTDNCGGAASITFVSDVNSNQTCTNRFTVTRTYLATDACGNSASCAQTITVFDNIPPSITCPGNMTVQCSADLPAVNLAGVITSDNCGGAASVTFLGDVTSGQTCANRFIVTRAYLATDACGNTNSCSQIITVFDNAPPSISCPGDLTVQCASQVPTPSTAGVVASDNCGGATTVAFINDVLTNQTCINRFTIVRTFSATDECGNSATCSQNIIVFDNIPPSITCPGNLTVQCASLVPAPNPGSVVTTDNCGGVATPAFVSDVITNQTCANRFTLTRTYSATDACGNSATCSQTITVFDNTVPTIACPQDLTVQCASLVPAATPGSIVTSDNCGGAASVTFVDAVSNQTCASRFTLTRTYIATDVCGNSATCNQIITVFDNTVPTITCPAGLTVSCTADIPAVNPASVTTADNCGGTATVTFVNDVITNQTCANRYTLTRTYRSTDACGNSASCSQIIIVNDVTPPTAICQNFMIDFGNQTSVTITPNDINNGSFDNCGGAVTLSISQSIFTCEQFNGAASIPVILTVTDVCGNSSTCQALVSGVGGSLAIDCPDDIVISLGPGECVAYVNYVVTAEALCGGSNVQIIQVDTSGLTSGDPFPIGVTTQTYIATNGFDTVSCSFTITVIEYDVPVVLACNDTINVSVTQNCDAHIFVDMVLEGTSYGCFNDYIISIMNVGSDTGWIVVSGVPVNSFYMVTITDPETGNSCWGKIHLEDKIAPQIICACPPNSEGGDTCFISCLDVDQLVNGNIPPYLYPQVIENCEYDLTIENIEVDDAGCGDGTVTVTWKVTDISNLMATCVQVFQIEPLSADSLVFPPNYVGQCGTSSDPDVTGWPTIHGIELTDDVNLCNLFLGYWDETIQDCGGGIKILRSWLVLDWCTLELVEASQIIKLQDLQGPILTCPNNITVGTEFWYCYANVSVPKPQAHDACSDVVNFSLYVNGGNIVNFGSNYVVNGLLIGTYTAIWTVSDLCGNSSTCSFLITVKDDVVPVANCDQHTIVALTNDGPGGVTLVPAEVFNDGSYDNCGPVTFRVRRMDSCIDVDWTTSGACVDDHPNGYVDGNDQGTVRRPCVPFSCCDVGAGPIMVELEVTDVAGNVNYCMVEAEVQDKISPFVECPPDITVSCDFWFNVQEGTFTDQEGNNNGNLDEDPLTPVFGNMWDAFRYPESVREDIIINDPGNNDYHQPHFWGIDGWADDNCEVNLQVRVRVYNDCTGDDLPSGAPANAVKLVERRFSASDGNQGIAPGVCSQRIWVVNFHPFFITDQTCNNSNPNDGVIWPCDVLLTTCPDSVSGTGEPVIFDNACSLIGVAYEDERFEFVEEGACFKILRKWSVIDWCQYNSQTGYGLWSYTQVIKVHDNEGPLFINCPSGPVTLCVADEGVSLPDNNQAFIGEDNPQSSSCSVHLNLCQQVREMCSDVVHYDVKLYLNNEDEFVYLQTLTTAPVENGIADLCFNTRQNSSQSIRNNGIPYNSPFCGDYHKILWSAEDGCGNWSHCEYLLRLEDCKQPSPVCINGLSTVLMPVGCEVTLWAKDFNASSFDDCTPEADLLFSFSGDAYEPSKVFTKFNIPGFGVELSLHIWVADGGTDDNCNGTISWNERNKDYCVTTVIFSDHSSNCSGSLTTVYQGEILTESDQPVSLVNVSLNSNTESIYAMTTIENGLYALVVPDVDGQRYQVIPKRTDEPRNGVSTLDLVRIQKHLLGKEFFNSPYQYIAADANNNQQVSAIDLLEIRKLILGIYDKFPNNDSWRFVDKGSDIADPANPWPFEETIQLQYDGTSHSGLDFMGVKIGDVNNSVKANALQILPRNANRVLHISKGGDDKAEIGKVINVALTIPEIVEGFQWTLETQGLEYLGVSSDDITITNNNVGVLKDGILTMSWNQENDQKLTEKKSITIVLQFMASQTGEINDMIRLSGKITEAEAYTFDNEILDVKLDNRSVQPQTEFALYQNQPNPWTGSTSISFNLPEAGSVKLSLFDATGKLIKVVDGEFKAGKQTILLNKKDIQAHGVLYYRLDSGNYSATKKMIRLE